MILAMCKERVVLARMCLADICVEGCVAFH
jgi:hypothetical protein